MKWFKHETDAHTNLKLQAVLDKHGLEAIAYYWFCVELVGLQSEEFKLKAEKCWKNYLKKMTGLETEKQEVFLSTFAELNLIDKKALKLGALYIPKMSERSDDYTKRVRRVSEHTTDNVPLEEKREEEIRTEENIPTPAQVAQSFFSGDTEELLTTFSEGNDRNHVQQEFQKFILYWTEKNRTGKKERWELEKVFDVKRRLYTWLSRAPNFSKTGAKVRGLA